MTRMYLWHSLPSRAFTMRMEQAAGPPSPHTTASAAVKHELAGCMLSYPWNHHTQTVHASLRQYMLHSDSKCFSQCMLHSVNAPLWKYMLHSYIICLHWDSTNCSSERVHTYSDSIYRNDLPSITVQDYKNMYFSRQYTPSVRQYICSSTQCTWVHSDNICLQ